MTDKPVDLKNFKHRRAMTAHEKAADQLRETMWQKLCELWAHYATEAPKVPKVPLAEGLTLQRSGDAGAVFLTVLDDLVSLAQAQGVDNGEILYWLLSNALCEGDPEGRLRELLARALNLLEG
jgi:hypothetical protein